MMDYIKEITQFLHQLTWINVYPWVGSLLSLTCVYLLNTERLMPGRYLGLVVAITWFTYGVLTHQWFFLFTNMVYFGIYSSSIIKHRRENSALEKTNQQLLEMLHRKNQSLARQQSKACAALNKEIDSLSKILRYTIRHKRRLMLVHQRLTRQEMAMLDIDDNDGTS